MRVLILSVSLILLLSFTLGLNPPTANEMDNRSIESYGVDEPANLEYEQYNATEWKFTGKQSTYNTTNNSYILDAGSTEDQNIQLRVSSNTSNLKLNKIYLDENDNIRINATETNKSIKYNNIYLDIQNYTRKDVNNVSAHINKSLSDPVELEREVCGCSMLVDPRT